VSTAEVLLDLAPDRLAAVHWLAADGRFSMAATLAAGRASTDGTPESVLASRPDLVFIDPFTRAETQVLLQHVGVPVLRTGNCSSLDDVRDNLRCIGYGMGLDAGVERLVQQMDARLEAVRAKAQDRAGWRLLSLDGALHSYGRGSLFDDLVRTVGAVNLAALHGVGPFRRLAAEEVLSWRPDAIVVGAAPEALDAELIRMRQDPALRLLPCVQAGRVACIPPALLASTSHHVAGAAEAIAHAVDGWGRP
jgi:iron complex transport system substrate-binding protein